MMKKLIVIGIVVAMVMGFAAIAMAADFTPDDAFTIYLKASTDTLGLTGAAQAQAGFRTNATNSTGTISAGWDGGTPEVEWYDATHALPTSYVPSSTRYGKDLVGTTAQPAPGTSPSPLFVWNFKAYAPALAGTNWYVTTYFIAGVATQWDAPAGYKLSLTEWTGDPTNGLSAAVAGSEYDFTSTAGTLNTVDGGFGGAFHQYTITTGTQYFQLALTPAIPEPGSLVALFSGLVGLVGYGIRRRK